MRPIVHFMGSVAACAFGVYGVRPLLRTTRCGRCRHEYVGEAWERLDMVDRMVATSIRALVTSWPDGVAIEIRRCRSCGLPIARKRTRDV
jgi:hypothetical protein